MKKKAKKSVWHDSDSACEPLSRTAGQASNKPRMPPSCSPIPPSAFQPIFTSPSDPPIPSTFVLVFVSSTIPTNKLKPFPINQVLLTSQITEIHDQLGVIAEQLEESGCLDEVRAGNKRCLSHKDPPQNK